SSFAAYVVGELLDMFVFNRLRRLKAGCVAPAAATGFGNAVDALVFFSVAFYASSDSLMAANWPEIAFVDVLFKLIICGLF
ncbi:hypothetical protein PL75_11330, partial [Neisseria arctica]